MDVLGKRYLIDHCVLRWVDDQKEKSFKVYVTDGIKNINDSVANAFSGKVFRERWYDMTNKKEVKDPKETADEIKSRIVGKLAALEK